MQSYNQPPGADGLKTAILRKGRAILKDIWAAAQAERYVFDENSCVNFSF